MADKPSKRPEFERLADFRVAEVFADRFDSMAASDGCVYITFSTSRVEGAPTGTPPTIKHVTSGRLVLTLPAAVTMTNQLTAMFQLMAKQGALRTEPEEPKTIQ